MVKMIFIRQKRILPRSQSVDNHTDDIEHRNNQSRKSQNHIRVYGIPAFRLPETVLADLADNNAYWAQYRGAASVAGQTVYDTVLKAYGDADGIRSYGTVVDLLTVYYRTAALDA